MQPAAIDLPRRTILDLNLVHRREDLALTDADSEAAAPGCESYPSWQEVMSDSAARFPKDPLVRTHADLRKRTEFGDAWNPAIPIGLPSSVKRADLNAKRNNFRFFPSEAIQ